MRRLSALLLTALLACSTGVYAANDWVIDSQSEWQDNTSAKTNIKIEEGFASASATNGELKSVVKKFDAKRKAKSITFDQSPVWLNWTAVKNVGPANLGDAPVMLSLGSKNYWMFGRYKGRTAAKKNAQAADKPAKETTPFVAQDATLEGFDIPLKTTPMKNQFDAPGGLKKSKGGYHAWQSRDMVTWVHHGPVTEGFSKWVTSAEHVDGKTYIYYDFPNDQDPHVYVDEDLTDGVPGKNMGKALDDPSDGSDSGFIRDLQGKFHVFFEDWSPINASRRSWDSPLAGHAVSEDGVKPFSIQSIAVDERTQPTGKKSTYKHPHWAKEDPDNYTNVAEFEIHEPNQPAYGDWAPIAIGGQYYLFGDHDPEHRKPMSVAWFTSSAPDKQFTRCGTIGKGHPDPDIGFAEGKFYLITQPKQDFTSPGPWVEDVEVRVGVDTNNDGSVDQWTDWQKVKETYDHTPGFAKQIAKTPASLDLSSLPEGFGFQFEVKLTDTTENQSTPMLDRIKMDWE